MDELEDVLKKEFQKSADYEESLLETSDIFMPNGTKELIQDKLSKQIKEREELYEKLTAEDIRALESSHKKLEKEYAKNKNAKKSLLERMKDFFILK